MKKYTVPVNCSDTFVARSICKICGSKPNINNTDILFRKRKYDMRHYYSNIASENIKANVKTIMHPIYRPGNYRSRILLRSKFIIKEFKNKFGNNFSKSDYLFCDCWSTSWVFAQTIKTDSIRFNRKSRINYGEKK